MAGRGTKRKLGRDKDHKKALFRNLISALILQERIKTTEAKAKSVRGLVDKLVNKAKKEGRRTKNQVLSFLTSKAASEKLYNEIIPRFKDKTGGFTRIVRLTRRRGDNAKMVIMEWVKKSSKIKSQSSKSKKKTNKKSKK